MSSKSLDYCLVGHRGFPAAFPENSIIGLLAALKEGATAIELDVQASKDGVPMVIHDSHLSRVAEGADVLSQLDAQALTHVSVHEPKRFGEQFYPTPLATLQQVAEALEPHSGFTLFVEIKQEVFEQFERKDFLLSVWRALAPIQQNCVIISFDLEVLRIAQANLFCPVGWVLTDYDTASLETLADAPVDYLACNKRKLPAWPEPLWRGPWQWFVYDVVERGDLDECVRQGVQWIETWDIRRLLDQLKGAL